MVHSQKAWCSHEGTNRTCDESSLCHVVPCRAFSTPRGTNARYADVAPINVSRTSTWYECSLCHVIPFGAFSTLCGANARYAGVVPVSVVQPSAAARVASAPSVHASVRLSIGALAQPAVAADAIRATRSRLFQKIISYSIFFRSQQRAAKRQTRWAVSSIVTLDRL